MSLETPDSSAPWQIRKETPGDAPAIHLVTEAAFRGAPHSSGTEALIVAALRSASALSLSFVAHTPTGLIGHIAVSPVQIEDGSKGWFGIGPLSVVSAWQRKGVGAALMQEALSKLRQGGAAGCVLLGDPAYYQRFGFELAAPLYFPGVPPEYFQALLFQGSKPSGEVHYHAAFNL